MRLDLSAVAAHAPTTVDGAARQAAVLAPVIDRGGEDHLLFIERADHLGDHPGEMGFPGGSREPSDTDLAATALREAKEEIGLDPDTADIVGRLDDIRTVSGYSVRPFVGRVPAREYVPDGREVAEVAIVAVARLVDPANYTSSRTPETTGARSGSTSSMSVTTPSGVRPAGCSCSCWSWRPTGGRRTATVPTTAIRDGPCSRRKRRE